MINLAAKRNSIDNYSSIINGKPMIVLVDGNLTFSIYKMVETEWVIDLITKELKSNGKEKEEIIYLIDRFDQKGRIEYKHINAIFGFAFKYYLEQSQAIVTNEVVELTNVLRQVEKRIKI